MSLLTWILAAVFGGWTVVVPIRDQQPPFAPPDDCEVVQPRSLEELVAFYEDAMAKAGDASPEPRTSPVLYGGTPVAVDRHVVAEIERTMHEYVACFNAGDWLRMAALRTDRSWQEAAEHDVRSGASSDLVVSLYAGPVVALRPEARLWLAGIREVRLQSDGRVSAIVTISGQVDAVDLDLVFIRVDDRYLIDSQLVELPTPSDTPVYPDSTPSARGA